MEISLDSFRETFKEGYEAFEDSRLEAREIDDLYHNRQYTSQQLAVLESRGQPAETFNVIKMFCRMYIGYYATVVNTIQVSPKYYENIDNAVAMNAAIEHTLEENNFASEGDKLKLSALLAGIMVSFTNVVDTGRRDRFNRPINKVECHYVPASQVVFDPHSTKDDYSDAEYLHRFIWLRGNKVDSLFGAGTAKTLDEYSNYLNIDEAEFDYTFSNFSGSYRVGNSYLITHTVAVDDNGKRWSCFWSGDTMLEKKEITYKECKWHYRVQKIHDSDKKEYYGVFREIKESQHAINQAIIKIQLMVNTNKVLVEEGAVQDIDEFERAYNRVSGVISVLKLNGIKVNELIKEVQDQYLIISNALDRIQRVLGINESFLGNAFASDSGRKVKLQQNQSIMQLRYLTQRIENFYKFLGMDLVSLIKQYYTAHDIFSTMDPVVGERWWELNRPIEKPTGAVDPMTGQPIMVPVLLPQYDKGSGDVLLDEEGNVILAPVSYPQSEVAYTTYQVRVEANSYNDEDEKAQLMLETVMGGQAGGIISQANPQGFLKIMALIIKSAKTKYSPNIVEILEQTAASMAPETAAMIQAGGARPGQQPARGPMSSELKLPTNTNEGL